MNLTSVATPGLWVTFLTLVVLALAVDLGLFHRRARVVGFKESLLWSGAWALLAVAFNILVWRANGAERGAQFLSAYLIEKSLSIDNVFVFVAIFAALGIPPVYQHRVLFWGILSALVMRAALIFAGGALLERFHWVLYVFGALLVVTGAKLLSARKKEVSTQPGWAMRFVFALIPSTKELDGDKFFTRKNGKVLATPLFVGLVLVELADLIFAVDSIPAAFAVTRDPFIVFTSNIFAILGLRSLFFVFAGLAEKFRYLKVGLAGVLVFVGVKMLLSDVYPLSPLVSCAVVASILGLTVLVSVAGSNRASIPHKGAPAA